VSDSKPIIILYSRLYAGFAESFCIAGAALALVAPPAVRAADETQELEEIVVTASLRPTAIGEFPASVTVLDEGVLRAAGLQLYCRSPWGGLTGPEMSTAARAAHRRTR